MIRELLGAGLLHEDVQTVAGPTAAPTQEPVLDNGMLRWRDGAAASGDAQVLATAAAPFAAEGGLRLMQATRGAA